MEQAQRSPLSWAGDYGVKLPKRSVGSGVVTAMEMTFHLKRISIFSDAVLCSALHKALHFKRCRGKGRGVEMRVERRWVKKRRGKVWRKEGRGRETKGRID